jgi:cysteine desulfurase
VARSHVLDAMGVDEALSRCAMRVSLGWNSDEADIDACLAALKTLAARARARVAA